VIRNVPDKQAISKTAKATLVVLTVGSILDFLGQGIIIKIVLNRIAKNEAHVRYRVVNIVEQNQSDDKRFKEQTLVTEEDEIIKKELLKCQKEKEEMKENSLLISMKYEQSKGESECFVCNNPYYLDYLGLFVKSVVTLEYERGSDDGFWSEKNREYSFSEPIVARNSITNKTC
jgi:hypothetical protein